MKISKTILKQIIKEELDAMQEAGHRTDYTMGRSNSGELGAEMERSQATAEQEDPLQKRVDDIIKRLAPAKPGLQTIDDPKEVIQLFVGILEHVKELNPDLTSSELQRTIDLMRTRTLPDLRKQIK